MPLLITQESLQSFGNFQLLARLGVSDLAEVFLAQRAGHGVHRRLILKRMHPELKSSKPHIRRFLREAYRSSLIDHPNVARIFDVGRVDDRYYLTMEHVNGLPLSKIVTLPRPLPSGAGCRIAIDLLDALHATHNARMVLDGRLCRTQCNLSMEKILLTQQGTVKLLESMMVPMNAGRGELRVQVRTDVALVGAILISLVTRGFGCSMSRTSMQQGPQQMETPLWRIVRQAMWPTAQAHFQSARALQERLELFLLGCGAEGTKARLASLAGALPGQGARP